jgi:hypothetical protein
MRYMCQALEGAYGAQRLVERRAAMTRPRTDEAAACADAMPLPARPLELKLGIVLHINLE